MFRPFSWGSALSVRCQRLRFGVAKPDDLPAAPSGGLLSEGFWQIPTLFVSATAIAGGLIQWCVPVVTLREPMQLVEARLCLRERCRSRRERFVKLG